MRGVRGAALALASGVVMVIASGCGQPAADTANGKKLFSATCGGCHTLKDAGTKGQTGPNLDDAWRGSRLSGIPDSQFRGIVHRWIYWAQPPMPRDLVSGQDAHDIAAYVASVAGTDKESTPIPAKPQIEEAVPADFVQGTPPGS
ncbi:MAG: cytochrome c [Thermoleophilia bacterium]